MSADRWSICPVCAHDRKQIILDYNEKLVKAYGKVSSQDYENMLKERPSPPPATADIETLREDWSHSSLVVQTGHGPRVVIRVQYYGSCEQCGLAFSVDHVQENELPLAESKLKS